MKTVLSVVEMTLAIPVGIISVPFLLLAFTVKAFLPVKRQATVVQMEALPEQSRTAS